MTDETPKKPTSPEPPRASFGMILNTVKWLCVAFVVGVLGYFGYTAIKVISKPAEVVDDTVETMSDAVKSGTESVKQSTSDLLDRLSIPIPQQNRFNRLSEAAFTALHEMTVSEPEGLKDRMFRTANLGGNEGRVCKMLLDFGSGDVPVFAAADNEAYATSKALGSNENRLIRLIVLTGETDVSLNTSWNLETSQWELKWKATTVKKPVSDELAATRAYEILEAASKNCR